MSLKPIFPETFFNLPHPGAPVVNIQFRTKIVPNSSIDTPDHWEEITINPNNFFDSFSLEDQGGAYMVSLNLFDRDFAKIENIIIRSINAARLANRLVDNPNYSKDDTEYFEFYVSKGSSANLRIRFGYSEFSQGRRYVDASRVSDPEWVNRTDNEKPVVRSPWLYFQISESNFNLQKEGLKVELKGFSVMGGFLDRAKMVQKFARLTGTPENIIKNIGEIVSETASASEDSVRFTFSGRKPMGYPTADGEEVIEIMLGGQPAFRDMEDGTRQLIKQYKSLKNVLDEICSKVKPILYDEDSNEINQTDDSNPDAETMNNESEAIDKIAKYGYMLRETENEILIDFYYQDPNDSLKNQRNARTYSWIENGQSIVKDIDIKTRTDFAALNLQIATVNDETGEMSLHVSTSSRPQEGNQESEADLSLGRIKDVTQALESPSFNAMFVNDIRSVDHYEVTNSRNSVNQAAVMLSRQIVANLNNTIFSGSIDLIGDPFYLFDSSIRPFSYLIHIVVRRPNYINENGVFVDGGVSYLSGYYAISKITHNISYSGFDTRLEVMKWPTKER